MPQIFSGLSSGSIENFAKTLLSELRESLGLTENIELYSSTLIEGVQITHNWNVSKLIVEKTCDFLFENSIRGIDEVEPNVFWQKVKVTLPSLLEISLDNFLDSEGGISDAARNLMSSSSLIVDQHRQIMDRIAEVFAELSKLISTNYPSGELLATILLKPFYLIQIAFFRDHP